MNEHLEFGRTEQKLNTRGNILMAAKRLLESGKKLTMENIAEEAGISRATIYRYYSNTDSVSTELILQLDVPNSSTLTETLKEENLDDALLNIQETYLDFILRNEVASRKFLGAILSSSDPKLERGKNRLNTLRTYFDSNEFDLDKETKERLIHIAVLLMGIEAVIMSKDVCGLDNQRLKETLHWGLKTVLKGCLSKD